MIINHNMGALNANRMMGVNQSNANKSMEKLSSGLKINRAGDDAAGLAISEKMRGQIRGLDQASANSQDAISMIQTGEGALSETHSILQRMRELAVQSATDTNTSDDRAKIQSEVDQLAKEITRISNTTEFNTQNLLAGGFNDTFQIGANKGQNISMSIGKMDAQSLGVAGDLETYQIDAVNAAKIGGVENATTDMNGYQVKVLAVNAATSALAPTDITKSNASADALTFGATPGAYNGSQDATVMIKIDAVDGTSKQVTQASYSTDGGTSYKTIAVAHGADGTASTFSVMGMNLEIADAGANLNAAGDTYTFKVTAENVQLQLTDGTNSVGNSVKVYNNQDSTVLGSTDANVEVNFSYATLKTAAANATTDLTKVSTASTAATFAADGSIASEAVAQKGINVSTQSKANDAIKVINDAITTVSSERSKLGAYQNRLEHTIANLGTSSENLTSAESRIRDVNMAKEMSQFSKNNILSQAAQAMLAQANQQPQQVLQLLR